LSSFRAQGLPVCRDSTGRRTRGNQLRYASYSLPRSACRAYPSHRGDHRDKGPTPDIGCDSPAYILVQKPQCVGEFACAPRCVAWSSSTIVIATIATEATFVVSDIIKSIEHYHDALGFTVTFQYGSPAFYACLRRDELAFPPARGARDQAAKAMAVMEMETITSDVAISFAYSKCDTNAIPLAHAALHHAYRRGPPPRRE
jgi:hypothetical protein